MDSNIEKFLDDIFVHLKNNLQSFDYQNTLKNTKELSNDEQQIRLLLQRCEKLLNYLKVLNDQRNLCFNCKRIYADNDNENLRRKSEVHKIIDDSSSYLDMSANRKTPHNDYMAFSGPMSTTSFSINNNNNDAIVDANNINLPTFSTSLITSPTTTTTTFHSSTPIKQRAVTSMIEYLDSDLDNYDICCVTTPTTESSDNKIQAIRRQTTTSSALLSPSSLSNQYQHQRSKSLEENEPILDCPYIGLPASHLIIHKSPKYGQLIRIEKRLFFDQTKKYYCGILNDWLLCYNTDGTSANNNSGSISNNNNSSIQLRPVICIQLSGTEIEHYGEGKRRDLCFQITNVETTKKFIFQSINEIDTKEWIHAIEAAIRGDFYIEKICQNQQQQQQQQQHSNTSNSSNSSGSPKLSIDISFNNSLRKLPTPPVQNKKYDNFLQQQQQQSAAEYIYEEPNALYQLDLKETSELQQNENIGFDEMPPDIPLKLGKIKLDSCNNNVEYDIPKAFQQHSDSDNNGVTSKNDVSKNKSDFQNKVKDVHTKLTNQFLKSPPTSNSPTNGENKLKKLVKKNDKVKNNETSSSSSPSPPAINKKLLQKNFNNIRATSLNAPVKNWFLTRLNKGSPIQTTTQKTQKSLISTANQLNSTEIESLLDDNVSAPTKGGKVNMIINQLEANGHLPMITQKFDRYTNTAGSKTLISTNTSLNYCYDDCSYEPMMASDS